MKDKETKTQDRMDNIGREGKPCFSPWSNSFLIFHLCSIYIVLDQSQRVALTVWAHWLTTSRPEILMPLESNCFLIANLSHHKRRRVGRRGNRALTVPSRKWYGRQVWKTGFKLGGREKAHLQYEVPKRLVVGFFFPPLVLNVFPAALLQTFTCHSKHPKCGKTNLWISCEQYNLL